MGGILLGWMNDLVETYDNSKDLIGVPSQRNGKQVILLPSGHKYVNAHIEVQITPKGEFYRGKVLNKDDLVTLIPTIEKSDNRASGLAPHLLHDYLKYVAGDYKKYFTEYPKFFPGYDLYIDQLRDWVESPFSNGKVSAIYQYLKNGTLIKDLINSDILPVENGELIKKWNSKEREGEQPTIFSVVPGKEVANSFVRFTVYDPNTEDNIPTWEDKKIIQSAENYSKSKGEFFGIDYMTGKEELLAQGHPSGLRYRGDSAKLISGNDTSNFTFLGRFTNKNQVTQIGYDTSQKAHNALKWLIEKQGLVQEGRVYLTWNSKNSEEISPDLNSYDYLFAVDEELAEQEDLTNQEFASKFNQALLGYQKNLDLNKNDIIHILILDSATKGRMGILYYNSFSVEDYIKRIKKWHERSNWRHDYGFYNKKRFTFYGAPSVKDMVLACYGDKANEKVKNQATQILYTCIVEGKKIPKDLSQKALNQSSSCHHFSDKWQWLKNINIACSMIKNAEGVDFSVDMDTNNRNRSYLFGRLLAVAHALESQALSSAGENRETSAMRYMTSFSNHPVKTWKIIRENLQPYNKRLSEGSRIYFSNLMQEISAKLDESVDLDKPLEGYYLLGFDSQLYAIYHKKQVIKEEI